MTEQLRYLTAEEIIGIPQLMDVQVSDDGQRVAYVKRVTNWDENSFVEHVWVYEAAADRHYALTSGNTASKSPRWSPDSRSLAVLKTVDSGGEKRSQIFVITDEQPTGAQISFAVDGVHSFRWSPDGQSFYYTSRIPESDAMKRRKKLYGDFEYVDEDDVRMTLFHLRVSDGLKQATAGFEAPSDLRVAQADKQSVSTSNEATSNEATSNEATSTGATFNEAISNEAASKPATGDKESRASDPAKRIVQRDDLHIHGFDIAPDGKAIVFAASPNSRLAEMHLMQLYVLECATRTITQLDIAGPISGDPLYSLDGTRICYTRPWPHGAFFDNNALEMFDLGSQSATLLTSELDESVYPVRWTDKGILVGWQHRTERKFTWVQEDGTTVLALGRDSEMFYGASVTKTGETMAYVHATPTHPAEVIIDVAGNPRPITKQYQHYEGHHVSTKQVVRWESQDGTEIEGILSTPHDFTQGKRYPLLVVVHGGPTAASFATPTTNRLYPIEQFVERGFIVLEPNYRGSSGYGAAFRKLNVRNLGVGDYWDVISGVDALVERGLADADKVGVMGWSQGGYISAFCTTYSDRFKAVSVGAGISNWMTYYVNTDIHPFTRHYLDSTPWDDEEIYRKTSPMTYVKNACTPTLIQHGDSDARVPTPNAYELYQGLQDVGVDVKLVIVKGMGHGPNKPGLNRALMKQNYAWFCHHILGDSLDGFWL